MCPAHHIDQESRSLPRGLGSQHLHLDAPVHAMNTTDLHRPLSSSELGELRAFLESGPSAVSLPWTEGFLTGIASTPSVIMPSDWYPVLLGDRAFDESLEEAKSAIGLIMRLFNQILDELNQGLALRPSRSLDEEQVSDWCSGYLEAGRMDPVWRKDEYGWCSLLPMGVLAGEFDLVGEEGPDGIIEDPTSHLAMYRRSLPTGVLEMHEYWGEWRRAGMQPATPAASFKVGRNEPCPCGSGLKYKKCCARKPAP